MPSGATPALAENKIGRLGNSSLQAKDETSDIGGLYATELGIRPFKLRPNDSHHLRLPYRRPAR